MITKTARVNLNYIEIITINSSNRNYSTKYEYNNIFKNVMNVASLLQIACKFAKHAINDKNLVTIKSYHLFTTTQSTEKSFAEILF